MSTTKIEPGFGPAGAVFDAGETIAHGAVHLDVTDLPRALAFWRDLLGLAPLGGGEADGVARLGAGGRVLIVLHAGAERPPQRGHSGLYHVALHLPDAREFARVIARLAAAGYPQAPTDHIFSQATYLDDPDGIGLELTLETPERVTEMEVRGAEFRIVDTEGRLRRPVEPLDTEAVFSTLRRTPRSISRCPRGPRWATSTSTSATWRRRTPSIATSSASRSTPSCRSVWPTSTPAAASPTGWR